MFSINPYYMLKKFSISFILVFSSCLSGMASGDAIPELTLSPKDRILVLAPHPDDEVLGNAGILQRAVAMKLPVKVVYFTYGDSNQWSFLLYRKHLVIMPKAVQGMGIVRRDEAITAASILGVNRQDLIFLGYPDFGTMNIWYSHWNDRLPLMSMLTRVTKVPYQGAFRPGALYKGEEIERDLRSVLRTFKPTKIFLSHPADHNGDHLSLYLFTRVAVWDEDMEDMVTFYPYLIHYIGWPKPWGFHPDKTLIPPEALSKIIEWKQYHLSKEEFDLKKAALQAHRSQYSSSRSYLSSFVRSNELFGDFPLIRLHLNENSSVFSSKYKFVPSAELPEELSPKEKMAFIGIEWKFVRWEGNHLSISIALSKPLAANVEASIYIFGYQRKGDKVPFASMPKISVNLGVLSYNVFDQAKRISQDSVEVKRSSNEIIINVPLKLIGNPDRILTSARTYLGNVPLDSASWMAVELN